MTMESLIFVHRMTITLYIMVLELSGVQFGLKSYIWFQNRRSAQREFDFVWLSSVGRSRKEVKVLGRGHECFQFFNQTNPTKVLVFDTSNLLLFLVRNESSPLGISFVAVALDFQFFLAQTIRLKKSNSKEPKRSRCCRGTKWRNQQNVQMACSTNQEQVFSPPDQLGVSYFALHVIKKSQVWFQTKTAQHKVQLPLCYTHFEIIQFFL